MRIAHISTFDSFIRANYVLSLALAAKGANCDHHVMIVRGNQIAEDQIVSILGGPPDSALDLDATLVTVLNRGYDWIILCAENTSCRRFFHTLSNSGKRQKPRVATLYPGIIFRHHLDGFSARMPADLVILNSQKDHALYLALADTLGQSRDNCFNLGPVTAIGQRHREPQSRNKVVFFDQPSVPGTPEEKSFIFQGLLKLADQFPEFEFCVKLRVSPKQMTLHKGGQDALRVLKDCNSKATGKKLSLIDGSSSDVIAQACLCLSVSSTALIEAIGAGCPAAAISDFGIDQEYGVSFFVGSGIVLPIASIDPVNPPLPNVTWIEENLGNPDTRVGPLVEEMRRISGLAITTPKLSEVFPAYGSREFHDYACDVFGERRTIERHYRKPRKSGFDKFCNYLRKRIGKRHNLLTLHSNEPKQ